MKRFYIITILAVICGLTAMAQNRPDNAHQTNGKDRIENKFFADRPSLVYDNVTNQIIVEGNDSEYYDVVITSAEQVVFTTVINGEYDIIDASFMTTGTYVVSLTSSRGNTYRWIFDHGLQLVGNFGGLEINGDVFNRFNGFTRPSF